MALFFSLALVVLVHIFLFSTAGLVGGGDWRRPQVQGGLLVYAFHAYIYTHDGAFGILTFFVWFEAAFLSVPFPHLVSIINGSRIVTGLFVGKGSPILMFFKSFFFFLIALRDGSRSRR